MAEKKQHLKRSFKAVGLFWINCQPLAKSPVKKLMIIATDIMDRFVNNRKSNDVGGAFLLLFRIRFWRPAVTPSIAREAAISIKPIVELAGVIAVSPAESKTVPQTISIAKR
jgi:hypothetical protein